MKRILNTALVIIASITILNAQTQEATTVSGKKVILNSDGSWKYKETEQAKPSPAAQSDCNYTTNEVDEFTGKKKLVLRESDFINYTSEDLKKYYKKKDYINCKVGLAQIENTKAAYFYWVLQTKEAYKYFGSIKKGATIMVKLVNGDTFELMFSKYDTGETKYDYGYTNYSSYVILDQASIDALKSAEIDKVRMSWSKGYEDYPVSNPRLFIDQLSCVE
jgi:hypothetical protein